MKLYPFSDKSNPIFGNYQKAKFERNGYFQKKWITQKFFKSGYFDDQKSLKHWLKLTIAKSGHLQKMDNFKMWIFCNSTAGVRFR